MSTTKNTSKPKISSNSIRYYDAAAEEIHRLSRHLAEIKKKLVQSEAQLAQLQDVLLIKIQSKMNTPEFPFTDGTMNAQSELTEFILRKLTLGRQIEAVRAELSRLKKNIDS